MLFPLSTNLSINLLIILAFIYVIGRDAYTYSVSRDGANEVALLLARFISSCLAEQIRLAHHKCMYFCKDIVKTCILVPII